VVNKDQYKPVGDWIFAPSANFVAISTRVGLEVQWIADFPRGRAAVPRARPRMATW